MRECWLFVIVSGELVEPMSHGGRPLEGCVPRGVRARPPQYRHPFTFALTYLENGLGMRFFAVGLDRSPTRFAVSPDRRRIDRD